MTTALLRRTTGLLTALTVTAGVGAGIGAGSADATPAPLKLSSSACAGWIQQGQTSGCVTRLQQLLNSRQYQPIAVDGVFGAGTASAVKKFQRDQGLVADGIVGSATKARLDPTGAGRGSAVVTAVTQLMNGTKYPYVWGGGHGAKVGATYGESNAAGTAHATGLDCSGFTRWAYAKAFGYDRLGSMGAVNQAFLGTKTTNPQPGDLVLYANRSTPTNYHHIAIYLGGGTTAGRIAQERTFGSPQVYGTLSTTPAQDLYVFVHIPG